MTFSSDNKGAAPLTEALRKGIRLAILDALAVSPNQIQIPAISLDVEPNTDGNGTTYHLRATITVAKGNEVK